MTLIKLLIMGRSYFYTDFLLDLTLCKCWPLREKKSIFPQRRRELYFVVDRGVGRFVLGEKASEVTQS